MLSVLKRFLIGKPLRTEQLHDEKLPVWKALPILSSDALSSLAYGTEQLLTVIAPFGALALWYSLPITGAIIGLLILLIISYRQVIFAYPNGGGAYIVSTDNLGWFTGLMAGASLLIDYTLTCAVSVAAGTSALTSAFPPLRPHAVLISVLFIVIIMILNLRGLRESGTVFAFPTYLFIVGMIVLTVISFGGMVFHGLPHDIPPVPKDPSHLTGGLTLLILLRAFSSGCSALTGIEAISNATPTFRKPETKNAARTLLILGLVLGILFAGTSTLAFLYHILPNPSETVLSQIAEHAFGRTFMYYFIQLATALILVLAANTAYSGFPLLASIMAKDKFMPRAFALRGDRLNFSNGIITLSLASILLIVVFDGNLDRLIPLYAIGVFLSFTLAQTGMVKRWWKTRPKGWITKISINALGAVVSFAVLLIFAVTKFAGGAWIVIILIPVAIFTFYQVRRHYNHVAEQLRLPEDVKPQFVVKEQMIVVPIGGVNQVVLNTVSYAKSLHGEAVALYVAFDEEEAKKVKAKWEEWNTGIRLEVTHSPYRSLVDPLLSFLKKMEADNRQITVLIPEFIPARWWHRLLHNQTALMLRIVLLARTHVTISTVPYHLKK